VTLTMESNECFSLQKKIESDPRFYYLPKDEPLAVMLQRIQFIEQYCPAGFCYWGTVSNGDAERHTKDPRFMAIDQALNEKGEPVSECSTLFCEIAEIHDPDFHAFYLRIHPQP
jgi:hypothetical protein